MARRKKDDAAGITLLIVFAVLILIAIATPIVILAGYAYNLIKGNAIKKNLRGNLSDFWLNSNEKIYFKEKFNDLAQVNKIIDDANKKGEDEGINRNQDGSFSARSNLGKELKNIIARHEPIQQSLREEIQQLKLMPHFRWSEFNSYIKNAAACILSLLAWGGTLCYYYVVLDKQTISDIYMPYLAIATNFFRDQSDKIKMIDGDIRMIAVATVVAIISYFAFGLIFKNPGVKYTPIPEQVTLENIDSY